MKFWNLLLLFVTLSYGLSAQEANRWYFGYKVGLDFRKGDPYIIKGQTGQTRDAGPTNAWQYIENEPYLVVQDDEGGVLFYSDGQSIFSKKHQAMDVILPADRTHAQMGAFPKPGEKDVYMIFCPEGDGTVVKRWHYTEVKAVKGEKLQLVKEPTLLAQADYTEAFTVIPHNIEGNYYVIFHFKGKRKVGYHIILFNKKGIRVMGVQPPSVNICRDVNSSVGVMAVNNSYTKIATSFQENGVFSGVEVVDFDRRSGRVSNPVFIKNFTKASDVYGVCFSPNDSLLYVGEAEGEVLNQYQLFPYDSLKINQSRKVLHTYPPTSARLGQIKMGPNKKLYTSLDFNGRSYDLGCDFIGVVHQPNVVGTQAWFSPEEICVPTTYDMHLGLGLPALIPAWKPYVRPTVEPVETLPEVIVHEEVIDTVVKDSIIPEIAKEVIEVHKGDTLEFGDLSFKPASFDFNESSFEVLEALSNTLEIDTSLQLQINGHTDDVGAEDANMVLSINRAMAVRNYLIKKGINPSRLKAKGFGETSPKVPNSSVENRKINRRVEFIVE